MGDMGGKERPKCSCPMETDRSEEAKAMKNRVIWEEMLERRTSKVGFCVCEFCFGFN